MKMTVILAVLLVSLLLMTGAAFATVCCADACYKVTGTDLTNPANSFTQDWEFCFDGDDLGTLCNMSGPTAFLQFIGFPEILHDQLISINPGSKGVYIKFHGDIFNGLYYNGTDKFLIHGVEEECVAEAVE